MKIARRLFVVPLANDRHGKTTMLKALVAHGGDNRSEKLTKGHRKLVSPQGRDIDAYVFGRSYQETEKGKHKSVLTALNANDPSWRERELIIFPSHADENDVKEMVNAAHRTGFDAVAAAVIVSPKDRAKLARSWRQNWDERWTLPNPRVDSWEPQVNALGCDLWTWICRAITP